MTVDELANLLESFSHTRRRAILFTLECHLSLEATILLDWKTARSSTLSDFAKDLLNQQPRHVRLDYCFWEFLDDSIAAPLFGLDRSFADFSLMQRRYDNLILVDREADRDHFIHMLAGASSG